MGNEITDRQHRRRSSAFWIALLLGFLAVLLGLALIFNPEITKAILW